MWGQGDYSDNPLGFLGLAIAQFSPLGYKNMSSEVNLESVYDCFWFCFTKPWMW